MRKFKASNFVVSELNADVLRNTFNNFNTQLADVYESVNECPVIIAHNECSPVNSVYIETIELSFNNKRTNTDSVINFIYFTSNFQYDFIECAFSSNIAAHLRSKFDSIVKNENKGYCTLQAFMKFMFELDTENKRVLIDWIDQNYNCGMF